MAISQKLERPDESIVAPFKEESLSSGDGQESGKPALPPPDVNATRAREEPATPASDAESTDLQVAREVFGVSAAVLEGFPWPVPEFSTSRGCAAAVVEKMLFGHHRERFEAELNSRAERFGWKSRPEFSGVATLLLVLTPDEICAAALTAVQSRPVPAEQWSPEQLAAIAACGLEPVPEFNRIRPAEPRLAKGCHRSHPHENMSPECERLTEVARAAFARAQAGVPGVFTDTAPEEQYVADEQAETIRPGYLADLAINPTFTGMDFAAGPDVSVIHPSQTEDLRTPPACQHDLLGRNTTVIVMSNGKSGMCWVCSQSLDLSP